MKVLRTLAKGVSQILTVITFGIRARAQHERNPSLICTEGNRNFSGRKRELEVVGSITEVKNYKKVGKWCLSRETHLVCRLVLIKVGLLLSHQIWPEGSLSLDVG